MSIETSGTGTASIELDNFREESVEDNQGTESIVDLVLDTQPEWFTPVKAAQEAYKLTNGKYQFHAKDSYATNCETHEYVTPSGEVGYVIYQYEDRDGIMYRRASNKGPEDYRTHDWEPIPVYNFG